MILKELYTEIYTAEKYANNKRKKKRKTVNGKWTNSHTINDITDYRWVRAHTVSDATKPSSQYVQHSVSKIIQLALVLVIWQINWTVLFLFIVYIWMVMHSFHQFHLSFLMSIENFRLCFHLDTLRSSHNTRLP